MRKDRLLRKMILERFVVTLRSGESFDGLLADADTKTIRLVSSFALSGKDRVSVDGELFIPRSEITYLQRPGVAE
jgi:hypothetical protein